MGEQGNAGYLPGPLSQEFGLYRGCKVILEEAGVVRRMAWLLSFPTILLSPVQETSTAVPAFGVVSTGSKYYAGNDSGKVGVVEVLKVFSLDLRNHLTTAKIW